VKKIGLKKNLCFGYSGIFSVKEFNLGNMMKRAGKRVKEEVKKEWCGPFLIRPFG